ncbi:pkd2 [Symbiodinium natans]|uniref:Pkd2 protein n=1 Tax=Symbiodinium natans TaxID=878477 RepID=A0A812IIN0_9DINO|nr:pkd2 [Symbiodinium natans]
MDDKKKLSVFSMLIYVLLIASAMNFVWKSGVIESKYLVTRAVENWVSSHHFQLDLKRKYFSDIDSIEDVQEWLRYALPRIMAPATPRSNFPLYAVRFSLRNVQEINNTEPRFQTRAGVTWKDKVGLETSSSSVAALTEGYENDDTSSYGVYREFGFNSPFAVHLFQRDMSQETDLASIANFSLGLQWCSKEFSICSGELLGTQSITKSQSVADVVDDCNYRCEKMERNGKLCYCWTRTQSECKFYHVPVKQMVGTPPTTPCWNHSAGENVYPALEDGHLGRTAHFPLLKRFVHSSEIWRGAEDGLTGFAGSKGFVYSLSFIPQEQIDFLTALQLNVSNGTVRTTYSTQNLLFAQLNDWMLGGFLGPTAGYLVVDWMNWNANFEVVSWLVLKFKAEASGLVTGERNIYHLVVKEDDLESVRADEHSLLWPDFDLWHALYIILVRRLSLSSLSLQEGGCRYEMILTGTKYFTSGWALMSICGIGLHIATIALRYRHHQSLNFTLELAKTDPGKLYSPNIKMFEEEAVAWSEFIIVASIMMVFLHGCLVQYLSDLIPRVSVLVDTVSRSITPVFFLVIILGDVFFGFVIWSNLLFGKSVRDFSDIALCAISLTEMIFGRLSVVEELRDAFPLTGFLFYLTFMILFFFILQYLSRAVVFTSFDDASKQDKEQKELVLPDLAGGNDQLSKLWKRQLAWGKKLLGINRASIAGKDLQISYGPFVLALYVTFVNLVLWVPESNDVVESLTSALKEPTFRKLYPLSGEIERDMSFDRIESPEDVMLWMASGLPTTLYNSSTALPGENELETYAAATQYKQAVIRDWNILLGQTPVRLSLKYNKLLDAPLPSATSRLPVPQKFRDPNQDVTDKTAAQPDVGGAAISSHAAEFHWGSVKCAANSTEEVHDLRARAMLEKYCGNYTTSYGSQQVPNGFTCMLSVDSHATRDALRDMQLNAIVTNQTQQVAIDFVAYNGNVDIFFYVAIVFDFTLSGFIEKDILVETIKLPDIQSPLFALRLFLEIVVIIFTISRLALALREVYRATLAGIRKGKASKFGERLWVAIQVISFRVLGNPFVLLDFLSGITTIVTLVMWYSFVLLDLTQAFFFPETPVWTPAQCVSMGLCSDAAVIAKFSAASDQMRSFALVCAANTIFLFVCSQKYLEAYPYCRVISNTIIRGAADIFCFLVVMVVLLMGYVAMGHTIFGTIMQDFSTVQHSLITCFQMFLGTFRNFEVMRQANSFAYYFYWYTYMVLFRYVLVNMFFAIIAKHFEVEDRETEDKMRQEVEAQAASGEAKQGFFKQCVQVCKSGVASLIGRDKTDHYEVDDAESTAETGMELTEGFDDDSMSVPRSPRTPRSPMRGGIADLLSTESPPDSSFITEQTVQEEHWQYLPEKTKKWAIITAQDIYSFIEEKSKLREQGEKHNKEVYDIDRILEDTEGQIQEKGLELGKAAEKVKLELGQRELRSLKVIHQDQESLAWYIMKREVELKKLEENKLVKQDRYEKMVNAAQSLVSGQGEEEEEEGGY